MKLEFRKKGIHLTFLDGGTTSWLQWVDVFGAGFLRKEMSREYFDLEHKPTSAVERRKLLSWLVCRAAKTVCDRVLVPKEMENLGYINQKTGTQKLRDIGENTWKFDPTNVDKQLEDERTAEEQEQKNKEELATMTQKVKDDVAKKHKKKPGQKPGSHVPPTEAPLHQPKLTDLWGKKKETPTAGGGAAGATGGGATQGEAIDVDRGKRGRDGDENQVAAPGDTSRTLFNKDDAGLGDE